MLIGYVFLSYSSKDRDFAEEVEGTLSRNNIDLWLAPDDIPVGNKYAQVINKAIKNCSCFLFLLSKNSLNSQLVAKEVERAVHYKRAILPIQIEEVELNDEFELYISTDQILSIPNFDEKLSSVQGLLAVVSSHTNLSTYEKSTLQMEILNDAKNADLPLDSEDFAPRSIQSFFHPKTKKGFIRLLILGVAALLLILALLASKLFGGNGLKSPSQGSFEDHYNSIAEQIENAQQKIENGTKNEFETPIPEGPNQIPEEYEDQIEALKYSDSLSLNNKTIVIKVGEGATPQSASVWKGCRILSQDTAVAVGDGLIVRGVSKGQTFIIVETPSKMTSVYYVVVE